MTIKGLPSAELFVSKGILPENLPPIFTTKNLWPHFSQYSNNYAITSKCVGENSIYNASKRSNQRRIFSIPHPSFIRDQGLFFEKNWTSIENLLLRSKGSASRPTFNQYTPRHVRITPHSELPCIRLKAFSRFRYCLVTDISRFFPSVYTHSIPWATNGKAAAKLDGNSGSALVFGNRLDMILRQSQSKQTIGIAIGPDSSKIVSEILLSAVDDFFLNKYGKDKPTYVRHVDDYWIAGHSIEECEKHLQNLRSSLRHFELDINETKTKIISTRHIFGEDWPVEFQNDIIDNIKKGNSISILSNVIEKASTTGDDGFIRHIIRKIDENHLWGGQWDILQHFLAQCAIQFPHSFDYVARVISWRKRLRGNIDLALWKDVTSSILLQNGSIGRDSEVVWALWLLKELGIKVTKPISDAITENCGSLTLAFLAHFSDKNQVNDKNLKQNLWDVVSGNPFCGPYWPLTLEMTHLNMANATWQQDIPLPQLAILHDKQASIVNWGALPKVFEAEHDDDDLPDGDPDSAIEDYGADYGDYEEDEEDEDEDNVANNDHFDFSDLERFPFRMNQWGFPNHL